MVHNYEGDGVLRISLDLLNITEELVNNLSSKGFQGQGGNVVDDDDRRTKKPINQLLEVDGQLFQGAEVAI